MSGSLKSEGSLGDALQGLNTTVSEAMSANRPTMETIWDTLRDFNFMLLEAKLVFSAIGIIYVASHAALRRPPSAAKASSTGSKKGGQKGGKAADEEEDDGFAQGLELSDAIMFPIMAGCMLVGLYYLLQWLKDPEILNKILRWYMSAMSLVSLLTLFSHGFDVVTSFAFPRYWRAWADGLLRQVDQDARTVKVCDDVGNVVLGQTALANPTPLPGILSNIRFSEKITKSIWDARGLLYQQWLLKFYAHGFGHTKTHIKLSHVFALLASIATTVVYNSTSSPFLSNMLGYGLCYGSLLLISPTNLAVGSLVLIGLFFYDITMVFYT
jgi:minor histocompatibility antigen H13